MPRPKTQPTATKIVSPFEIRELRTPDYTLQIDGNICSKKNAYGYGKNGPYKTKKIQNCETMVYLQVPEEMRDLKLVNPSIRVRLYAPKEKRGWTKDRDNVWTTLADALVNIGLFKDDSINQFNGVILFDPVILSDSHRCEVSIWRNE